VIPVLVTELAGQWRTRTWCGPEATAGRLSRFGPAAAEAVPYLRRFWLRTPHSYERAAYLEALAAIDRGGLDQAHTESLWDCEDRARLLGIAHAPDHPDTVERIAALRDDPMEDPEVRAAAEARLALVAPHQDR
jgi:alkylhydroperoxidase family enzyme